MRQQQLNLVDIIRKNLFDPSGAQSLDIAQRLFFQFPLQGNAQVLQCVVGAHMGKCQTLYIKIGEQDLAYRHPGHPDQDIGQVNLFSPGERCNNLIKEIVRNHMGHNPQRHQHGRPDRVFPVFADIRRNLFKHLLLLFARGAAAPGTFSVVGFPVSLLPAFFASEH